MLGFLVNKINMNQLFNCFCTQFLQVEWVLKNSAIDEFVAFSINSDNQ